MKGSKVTALILSGVLAASVLTGCGVDKNTAVAIVDGEEIPFGIANFAARLQQAQSDDFYVAYFGEDVWSSDLYGNGTTMEEDMKESTIHSLRELYLLRSHAGDYGVTITDEEKTAISNAALSFMGSNQKDAIEALGATQEVVEEYLELLTIRYKMYDAIIADADTEVSEEEARTSAYSYVRVSNTTYTDADGNTIVYTEDELEELSDTLEDFVEEAKKNSLENAAEAYEYTVSSGTFSANTTSLDESVLEALQGLTADGEISDVVETDGYFYVLRMDSLIDEDATETNRQSIIEERQSSLFTETLEGWEEAADWTLKESVWAKVSFDNLFTTYAPETETEEETEEVSENGTEAVE